MKIGDKVRFLSEKGGGRVAGFQGKNIVLVEDEDGFQIPTALNEVIVIDEEREYSRPVAPAPKPKPAPAPAQQRPAAPPKPAPEERKGGDRLSVYLAFVPVDLREVTKTRFETYLVNDSNYYVRFALLVAEGSAWQLKATDEVEPNTKLYIEEFGREALNDMQRMAIQLLAYKRERPFALKDPVSVQLRIDPVKFYKLHTFRENDFFEQPALLHTIIENDRPERPLVVDAKRLKEELYTPSPANAPQERTPARQDGYVRRYEGGRGGNPFVIRHREKDEPVVVDLHADEILETTAGMKPVDILNYQLDVFHRTLADYGGNPGQKIVFIHGKGEGVLRRAIINELNYKYKNYPYQDASFQEYGYGATQVTIKNQK